MPLSSGVRLGAYAIEAPLGAGGMGEVYRARDTRLDRAVAVKVLSPHVAADLQLRDRFEREARAIAALHHPHICTLYDVGDEGDITFLVMEYLEGETLESRLGRGPLPANDATRLAIQIAAALDCAHDAGIVHRDLKPANIMLTLEGAKLLDFGLAKLTDVDVDLTRTAEGVIVGTAAYMSPEQAEGKPLDRRSDAFSFGAVLYEMLTGRRAFGGATIVEILGAVLHTDPPRFQAPRSLVDIVTRCLAKGLDQRFQSMSEVKAALQRVTVDVDRTPSIAVLPFSNMSADPENEYFSDGLAEEIINALSAVEGLRVVARTSSFSFKGKLAEIGEIARRLNVDHVLEGSVRKSGNRVRVTTQLVDVSNGYHLWSERYDRELADIFDVQDDIARAIVQRLKVALRGGTTDRFVKAATNNIEAYQDYLKGRALLYRRGPWIASALESFQRAVALDPNYAQAWAGIADSYTVFCYSGVRRPLETMPLALDAATRAVQLDATSSEAHNALACVALLWERDFRKAERGFREALRLNPHYIQARCWYGLFFLQWSVGRFDEGLAEMWRAVESDPLSGYTATCLSLTLAGVERFADATQQAKTAVQRDPESFIALCELGWVHNWNRQHDSAITLFEPLWANSPHQWIALGLIPAYARAGRREDAQRTYESLIARRANDYISPYVLAVAASELGDHDAAIRHCEAAIEERDMLFSLQSAWWPEFEAVRRDVRFAEIAARFNTRRS